MGREFVMQNIDGCPIPEDGDRSEITQRLLDYWPVWDLQDRLTKDGIEIDRAAFRVGWVKLNINWYRAEIEWSQRITAEIVRDIVAMCGNKEGLYLNHWQVIKPPHLDISQSWNQTLNTEARQAIAYFRTCNVHRKSVVDLLQHINKEEVNSIILASAFSLMEKDGIDDKD